jgi:membrane-bound lytic murein transglycosylase B
MRRRQGLRLFARAALVTALVVSAAPAQTPPEEFRPLRAEVESFILYMAQTHGFDARELHRMFSQLKPSQGVQRAISAPSTAKPWHEFRSLFVDQARIENGARFWDTHAELLARARAEFGVPEAIIVSIVGIETRYGRVTGGFRVLDALHTLAFEGQNRTEFFRQELEHFLLLAREQRWDPLAVSGSYAGAMGLPQFMPSSYRRYAIDYSGDGGVDLWGDPADVIGSVASYLRQFGWKDGDPVVAPVRVDTAETQALIELGIKPSLTVDQWRMRGVEPMGATAPALAAALFRLDLLGGAEYWLGFDNFYAILQYNRSRNYAMAVHDLAREIVRERDRVAAVNGAIGQ